MKEEFWILCTDAFGVFTFTAKCVSSVPSSSAQSCLTLWDSMDCSPPDSSVHGILQARILEWVAIPSFRRTSQPRDWTLVSCIGRWGSLRQSPQGSPFPTSRVTYASHILGKSLPVSVVRWGTMLSLIKGWSDLSRLSQPSNVKYSNNGFINVKNCSGNWVSHKSYSVY